MPKVYGSSNPKTGEIKVNKSMNHNGVEYLDTILHEKNHLLNPKMSECGIINKTEKERLSILAII